MKIKENENYVILEDDRNNIIEFSSFLEYIIPKKSKGQNIIINLLKYNQLTLDELLLFLKTSNEHRASNQSLVIINDALNPDDFPSEMIIVPTIKEAEDIIEMEKIERELGL